MASTTTDRIDMGFDSTLQRLMDRRNLNPRTLSAAMRALNETPSGVRFPRANLSPSSVRRMIEDGRMPNLEELILLAECFGVSLDDLAADLHTTVGPTTRDALTDDERIVLRVFHAYQMSAEQVIDLLAIAHAQARQNGGTTHAAGGEYLAAKSPRRKPGNPISGDGPGPGPGAC